MTLFGKRVIADAIKLRISRRDYPRSCGRALSPMTSVVKTHGVTQERSVELCRQSPDGPEPPEATIYSIGRKDELSAVPPR